MYRYCNGTVEVNCFRYGGFKHKFWYLSVLSYLCKFAGRVHPADFPLFDNDRWSSQSWFYHTASFPWIEMVILPETIRSNILRRNFRTFPNLRARSVYVLYATKDLFSNAPLFLQPLISCTWTRVTDFSSNNYCIGCYRTPVLAEKDKGCCGLVLLWTGISVVSSKGIFTLKIYWPLTNREGGPYWKYCPEVVAVRTEHCEVRTKTTESQFSHSTVPSKWG